MSFLPQVPSGMMPSLPTGFGPTRYDPDNPGGFFSGFTMSVDGVSDPSLGGGWQSMSLGSMEMNTNDLPAGGYLRTSFREIERITYGSVNLAAPAGN